MQPYNPVADMTDRILWNGEPSSPTDAGDIDEIVLHNVTVHIEQMGDRCWWIALYTDDPDRYWMGNFTCDSRGRMTFSQQENAGIDWQDERTHEENR